MKKVNVVMVMLSLVMMLGVVSQADTMTLYPTDDAATYSHYPDSIGGVQSNGTPYNYLWLVNSSWDVREGFLKYDISSLSGKTVTSATLTVTLYATQGDDSNTVNLNYCNDDSWNEGAITYNNQPSDRQSLGTSITINSADPAGTSYTFASTSNFVNAIKNDSGLLTLRLLSAWGDYDQSRAKIYSKEGAGSTDAYKAYLTVEYVPEPATIGLLAFGFGFLKRK